MISALALLWLTATPQEAVVSGQFQRGHITNDVHPGDPVQETVIAGFATRAEAVQFIDAGFVPGNLKPTLATKLARGQTVNFTGSEWLVFYFVDDQGQRELLSLTRVHADLHLIIGSCGFQFLLNVYTGMAQPETHLR